MALQIDRDHSPCRMLHFAAKTDGISCDNDICFSYTGHCPGLKYDVGHSYDWIVRHVTAVSSQLQG